MAGYGGAKKSRQAIRHGVPSATLAEYFGVSCAVATEATNVEPNPLPAKARGEGEELPWFNRDDGRHFGPG
jgi:hypothetical protein